MGAAIVHHLMHDVTCLTLIKVGVHLFSAFQNIMEMFSVKF